MAEMRFHHVRWFCEGCREHHEVTVPATDEAHAIMQVAHGLNEMARLTGKHSVAVPFKVDEVDTGRYRIVSSKTFECHPVSDPLSDEAVAAWYNEFNSPEPGSKRPDWHGNWEVN